jgi:type IV secretory pathway VirD2 relaxase
MPDMEDFEIRPGTIGDRGRTPDRAPRLAAEVKRAAMRGGHLARRPRPAGRRGTGTRGRGRNAGLRLRADPAGRRVVIKARVVRQKGMAFRSAPLARHIAYLERDGVTRDGRDASMFDAASDAADRDAFAARCADDRHHFRFIVSPEDAGELDSLRDYTRDLMGDVARDLGTQLDWVAVDHWNTDNPHVHVLLRGVTDDGQDLVIDRGYVSSGMRARAEQRMTLELGPRTAQEIAAARDRDVEADRWTRLDHKLRAMANEQGQVDLRRDPGGTDGDQRRLIGRAMKLERMGLAQSEGSGRWRIDAQLEPTLRDLATRGDIIRTLHRAMSGQGWRVDPERLALHGEGNAEPVIGRLVERGLRDELAGTAYAVIDGVDGRHHHVAFASLELTGDAADGAIVEVRSWTDARARARSSLAVRSDLTIGEQVTARGATWLDRQLVARDPVALGDGFGRDVAAALAARREVLIEQGLGQRSGAGAVFVPNLLATLAARDLAEAADRIAARTGLDWQRADTGDAVCGIYRERVTLASGRFAMIDNGLGFQLVPWRPSLDLHIGETIGGEVRAGGGIGLAPIRERGLSL